MECWSARVLEFYVCLHSGTANFLPVRQGESIR